MTEMGMENNSTEIYFMSGEHCSFNLEDEIHIWRFPASGLDFSCLSKAEIERASRFRLTEDKLRFSVGRQGLRLLLSKYLAKDNREILLSNDQGGKPFLLDNSSGIYFNISHSGNWVLVALADGEIGIDIEKIKIGFQFCDLTEECFSKKEQVYISSSKNQLHAFYVLWTRKEAFIKACGFGLGKNLKNLEILDECLDSGMGDEIWKIRSIPFSEEYAAACVYSKEVNHVVYLDGSGLIS
jgi:4'-phosphopantetheinyl transferase